MKGHFFPKKLQKGTSDLKYPMFIAYSIYTLLLIEQHFQKNKFLFYFLWYVGCLVTKHLILKDDLLVANASLEIGLLLLFQ